MSIVMLGPGPLPTSPKEFTTAALQGTPAEIDARMQALAAETAQLTHAGRAARDAARRARGAAYLAKRFGTEAAKVEPSKVEPAKAKPLTEAQRRIAAKADEDAAYRRYWPA